MSIPFNLGNDSLGTPAVRNEETSVDGPIKPFRLPSATALPRLDQGILRELYDDKKEFFRAIWLIVIMSVCIVISLFGKAPATYAMLALSVVTIVLVTLMDTWTGVLLFVGYLGLEGMFKYTTEFSQVSYIAAPVMCFGITISWYISFRNTILLKQSRAQDITDDREKLFQNRESYRVPTLPPLSFPVFSLILLSLIQAFNPDTPNILVAINGGIVWYIGPMLFFFVSYYSLRRTKQVMGLLYTLICTGFVMCVYAIIQFVLGREWCYAHIAGIETVNAANFAMMEGKQLVVGAFRPISTTTGAGGYCVIASYALLASLILLLLPKLSGWRRIGAFGAFGLIAGAIVLSSVRQFVILDLIAIVLAMVLSIRNLREAVRIYFSMFGIAAILVLSFVIADRSVDGKFSVRFLSTLKDPVSSYKKQRAYHFIELGKAVAVQPFGAGIRRGAKRANYNVVRRGYESLNDRETQWNAIHDDLGVFSLLGLAAVCIGMCVRGWQIVQKLKDVRLRRASIFVYCCVVMIVIGTFGGPSIQSNYLFWMFCGVLLALPGVEKAEHAFIHRKLNSLSVPQETTV